MFVSPVSTVSTQSANCHSNSAHNWRTPVHVARKSAYLPHKLSCNQRTWWLNLGPNTITAFWMRTGTARNPLPTFIKPSFSLIHFHGACHGPYQQSLHTDELHQNLISITHIVLCQLHILQGLQPYPCCLLHTHTGTVYTVNQMPRPSSSLLPDTTWVAHSAYRMGRADEPMAHVPKMAPGKISLARGIHCCPNFLISFARRAFLYCKKYVCVMIILRWIFKKWNVGAWTGLIWLRRETGGVLLWMRQWTFGFHKM